MYSLATTLSLVANEQKEWKQEGKENPAAFFGKINLN